MLFKSKKEVIEFLTVNGVEKDELSGMKFDELKAKAEQFIPVEETELVEEQPIPEEVEPPQEVKVTKEEVQKDVVCEQEIKLRVNDIRVVHMARDVATVIVENLGGGDAYVSDNLSRVTTHDVIRPGETRTFKGAQALLLRSASRPILKIAQFM